MIRVFSAIVLAASFVLHCCLHGIEPPHSRALNAAFFAAAICLLGADPIRSPLEVAALALWLSALVAGAMQWRTRPSVQALMEMRAWFVLLPAWALPYFTLMDWDKEWQKFPLPSVAGSTLGILAYWVWTAFNPHLTKLKRS